MSNNPNNPPLRRLHFAAAAFALPNPVQQQLDADGDQYRAAKRGGSAAKRGGDAAAQQRTGGAEDKGDGADEDAAWQQTHIRQKGEADPDSQRVYAGGHGQRQHPPPGQLLQRSCPAAAVQQHPPADERKEKKADVRPPKPYRPADRRTEQRAEQRHQALEGSEISPHPQRVPRPQWAQRHSGRKGNCERVH